MIKYEEISKQEYDDLKTKNHPHLHKVEMCLGEDKNFNTDGMDVRELTRALFRPCSPPKYRYYKGSICIIINSMDESQVNEILDILKHHNKVTLLI